MKKQFYLVMHCMQVQYTVWKFRLSRQSVIKIAELIKLVFRIPVGPGIRCVLWKFGSSKVSTVRYTTLLYSLDCHSYYGSAGYKAPKALCSQAVCMCTYQSVCVSIFHIHISCMYQHILTKL